MAGKQLNARRRGDPNGPFGEFNPRLEISPSVTAVVHLGSLKAKTSDEQYCMLDSGANVLVIPWKPGNEGRENHVYFGWRKQDRRPDCVTTLYSLTCSSYCSRERGASPSSVKEALVLLPISYVVRIANYRVSWKLVLDKDQFLMTDSWGDNVPVTEQEDLTFISKATFWRVGHDLFHFANKVDFLTYVSLWYI